MRIPLAVAACVLAAGATLAGTARADDGADVRKEIEALKQQLAAQERHIRELENKAPTQDEIDASVSRYLAGTAGGGVLVGGDEGGKVGFAKGGKPFIQQGANKVSFIFRNQVRYEAFLYSDDAVGTLSSPADTLSGDAPRDRSGFEIERLYLGIEGTFLCEDLSYQLILNFDSDTGSGVEKEYAWLDWKYAGEHHVRAGVDKVPFTYEQQNSTGSLAFVERSLFTQAFALNSDTGAMLWGNFGGCDCPKAFLYKVMASNGEGTVDQSASVFSADAFDTYSDQPLLTACLEWTPTCKEWKFDEVDHRSCEERCRCDASVGVAAYYEDDDDSVHRQGLAYRSTGPLERWGAGAWVRARWNGWSMLAEWAMRSLDYASGAPEQVDMGATAMVHYRFADSNWGLGLRGSMIWLDDDYLSLNVGASTVDLEDTITEVAAVVNYFFWDHNNKISADVSWIKDNSAVSASSSGNLVDPKKGVVVEDGVMIRVQWQVQF